MAKGYKTGGRQKGTRNQFSVCHYRRVLNAAGCDPFNDLVKLVPSLQPHQQAQVLTTILSYVSRRPKEDDDHNPPANRQTPIAKKRTDELLAVLQNQNNETAIVTTTEGKG